MRIILLILIFSFPAFAADEYNCSKNKEKITKALGNFPACDNDDDCRYFDYGYPFQPKACVKAIVSKSVELKTIRYLEAIEEYNKNCVYNNLKENKKFDNLRTATKESECKNLPRVFCLKGVCRNQFYPLIFDDVDSVR